MTSRTPNAATSCDGAVSFLAKPGLDEGSLAHAERAVQPPGLVLATEPYALVRMLRLLQTPGHIPGRARGTR